LIYYSGEHLSINTCVRKTDDKGHSGMCAHNWGGGYQTFDEIAFFFTYIGDD